MSRDAIIERIRKLLKLAGNAGSEAEAALAADRAADLMAKHEIHEAMLATEGASEIRTPEPIEKCHRVTATSKRVAWHMNIAGAVDETYGAQAYWYGGNVVLFGRLSAVQAAAYTIQYLIREIDRLTDRLAAGQSRAYRNAFRLGCSSRVAARIREEHAKREEERKRAAARGAAREVEGVTVPSDPIEHAERVAASPTVTLDDDERGQCLNCGRTLDTDGSCRGGCGARDEEGNNLDDEGRGDDHDEQDEDKEPEAEPEIIPTAQALAVIDRDREEVKGAYKEYSKKWRKGHSIGNVSSGGGYRAGREAGDRVSLGGRSRGGLAAGQGSLKKGRR